MREPEVTLPEQFYRTPHLSKLAPFICTRKVYRAIYERGGGTILACGHLWSLRSRSVPNAGLVEVWVEREDRKEPRP